MMCALGHILTPCLQQKDHESLRPIMALTFGFPVHNQASHQSSRQVSRQASIAASQDVRRTVLLRSGLHEDVLDAAEDE